MTSDLLIPLDAHQSPDRRAGGSLLLDREPGGTFRYAPLPAYGGPEAARKAMETDDGNTRWLPSGLVTFVFTDIEGSTRLYKALGQDVATQVFDQHNELLRSVWDRHGGHEIHTEGDSFFVVFEDPNAAVAACIDVQQELAETRWPENGNVKVRIGIHSGLAAPRHNDYMALSVHQAARVMSAASGDQILITDAIADALMPFTDFSLVRTGAFRIRDFDQAPVLHRVETPTRQSNEQPPRATPANHHNLVPRLTSFVGRNSDVVAVNSLLEPAQVVTLVGLGGMGKTRLATEVGLAVEAGWEHGVWMVELAEVVDPELIAEEVATSIGVDTGSVGDRWNDVLEFIGDKSMLLIFDNAEHLIDECARLIPELLRSSPHLAIMATSREPLNCQGEIVYRLQPLDQAVEAAPPAQMPSVRLFVDRARAASSTSVLSDDDLTSVVEICGHLDGLPLAIEIAAAQVGVLQLTEILDGLSNRFRLLRSRDRALPDRQRTMEGLLGWSYHLLTEPEQRAFCRLAVFAGSFSIDAAEAALAGHGLDADDVPELVWALVDKSLIAADLSVSATRYRLLESVQQYAMRLLIDNDDPVRVANALGDWLLQSVGPWVANDRTWLGDVELELANIRSVVDMTAASRPESAQQLMCVVGRFRDSVQSYRAGLDELQWASKTLPLRSPSRVALLCELADLHLRMADAETANDVLVEAAAIQAEVGPPDWNDVAVPRSLGEIANRRGDYDGAIRIATEALAHDHSPRGTARLWSLLGIAQCSSGDLVAGLESLERCLGIYLNLHDAAAIAVAHGNVAEAAWRSGDRRKAAKHQQACLDDGLVIGQKVAISHSLIMAARLARSREHWETALPLYQFASDILTEAGHQLYEDEQAAMHVAFERADETLGSAAINELRQIAVDMNVIDAAAIAQTIFADETSANLSKQ